MANTDKTLVSFRMAAGPFVVFTYEMAQSMIGQSTVFKDMDNNPHMAKITNAQVKDHGTSVEITLEVFDPTGVIKKTIQQGKDKRTSSDQSSVVKKGPNV